MRQDWTPNQLERIAATKELEIATRRSDGTWRAWTPIWVVRVDDQLYVRTWYRRQTGWFGAAAASGRARIRTPGMQVAVTVDDLGSSARLRAAIDAAYQAKYGRWGGARRMVSDDAAATTLRLNASSEPNPGD